MLHQIGPEIDYISLLGVLKDYKSPRDRISRLVACGDLIRVRKGLYVLGPKYEKPYSVHILANLIYGPSYISGISALAFYGAIPEQVKVILSRTIAKPREFNTPVGKFVYRNSTDKRYTCGLSICSISHNRQFLIASREKALVEELLLEKELKSIEDVGMWMESNRIDEEFIAQLRMSHLQELQSVFKDRRLDFLMGWIGIKHLQDMR